MKEQLKQIFDENADCLSATATSYVMTSDKFIEVVSEIKAKIISKDELIKYLIGIKETSTDENVVDMYEIMIKDISSFNPLPTHPQTTTTNKK